MAGKLYLGLISGTSMDGIDAVLLEQATTPRVLAAALTPYTPALKNRLVQLVVAGQARLDEVGELHVAVAEEFAAAALALLARANTPASAIAALGSHGQTVRHGADRPHPFSLQIGDPSVLAERTGITTVADFRSRDIAAGGQGAPLLPAFHACVFADAREPRAVLNLGGIANVTLLGGDGGVIGYDTGPANCLLDAWYACHQGGRHDPDGAYAASGQTNAALLAALLAEPYFARGAPKSTGRELFDLSWLERRGGALVESLPPADVQATLAELTARTVADQLPTGEARPRRLVCCGGGVHNGYLMGRLAALRPDLAVESSAAYGLDPDFVEAAGFAWLASRALDGLPGNLPGVTGARGPRRLGGIYHAR